VYINVHLHDLHGNLVVIAHYSQLPDAVAVLSCPGFRAAGKTLGAVLPVAAA